MTGKQGADMIKSFAKFLKEIWDAIKPTAEKWEEIDRWSRENGYW